MNLMTLNVPAPLWPGPNKIIESDTRGASHLTGAQGTSYVLCTGVPASPSSNPSHLDGISTLALLCPKRPGSYLTRHSNVETENIFSSRDCHPRLPLACYYQLMNSSPGFHFSPIVCLVVVSHSLDPQLVGMCHVFPHHDCIGLVLAAFRASLSPSSRTLPGPRSETWGSPTGELPSVSFRLWVGDLYPRRALSSCACRRRRWQGSNRIA
jgi:hypothetical protein